MLQTRTLFLVLAPYALSLFALAIAGLSGWTRCGRGADCAPDLAWAVIAAGPAALIAIIMLLLLRVRAGSRFTRSVLLAATIAVAMAPFAVFIFPDARFIPAFIVLLAGAVWLLLHAEDEAERRPATPSATPADAPVPQASALPAIGARPARPAPDSPGNLQSSLRMIAELSSLNRDILQWCEALVGRSYAGVEDGRSPGRRAAKLP